MNCLIYDNQFEYNQLIIQKGKTELYQIQEEINYLNISPSLEQNIWYPSKYIIELQKVKIHLLTKIGFRYQTEKEIIVIQHLLELINRLDTIIIKSKEFNILRYQIIQQIIQIIEKKPTHGIFKKL